MKNKKNWLINGILCLLTCVWLAPIVFVLLNTLKGKQRDDQQFYLCGIRSRRGAYYGDSGGICDRPFTNQASDVLVPVYLQRNYFPISNLFNSDL